MSCHAHHLTIYMTCRVGSWLYHRLQQSAGQAYTPASLQAVVSVLNGTLQHHHSDPSRAWTLAVLWQHPGALSSLNSPALTPALACPSCTPFGCPSQHMGTPLPAEAAPHPLTASLSPTSLPSPLFGGDGCPGTGHESIPLLCCPLPAMAA